MRVHDVANYQVFLAFAKTNSHQRFTEDIIPPSPGDESSLFWKEKTHKAAKVLCTTVHTTQPLCHVYRNILKVFSSSV